MSLGELLGRAPAASGQDAAREAGKKDAAAKDSDSSQTGAKINRVSLQRQTAGRGGKTVTLVIVPNDCAADLDALAKQMRRGLGCGSRVENRAVVLQGDIIDRAEQWLTKYGVKKIVK